MYKGKRIIGIIPARSGSKGLVDKNIMTLKGKPMLAYTIEAAKESQVFERILVSTDAKDYADIAKAYGGLVPFMRPAALANDHASSGDVILHVLEEEALLGHDYDCFILLQPTSPLRRAQDIVGAVDLYLDKTANAVVSVCKEKHSPLWSNVLEPSLSMDDFIRTPAKRRQEISDYYRLNGAIYLADCQYFKQHQDFYHDKSFAYVMDELHSVDIDDSFDFLLAEFILNR